MANNYSAGTVQTNFNEEQFNYFLRQANAYITSEQSFYVLTIEEAMALPDDDENILVAFDGYDAGSAYNMESFDWEAVTYAIKATFDKYRDAPNAPLTAEAGVAFYCDKPRPGEFGGLSESFHQHEMGFTL